MMRGTLTENPTVINEVFKLRKYCIGTSTRARIKESKYDLDCGAILTFLKSSSL